MTLAITYNLAKILFFYFLVFPEPPLFTSIFYGVLWIFVCIYQMEVYFFFWLLILRLENLFYENKFDYCVSLVRVKKPQIRSSCTFIFIHFFSFLTYYCVRQWYRRNVNRLSHCGWTAANFRVAKQLV